MSGKEVEQAKEPSIDELKESEKMIDFKRLTFEPHGTMTLPRVDLVTFSMWEDLRRYKEINKVVANDTEMDVKIKDAIVVLSFVSAHGVWDFEKSIDDYLTIFRNRDDKLPIQFVHWLTAQFKRYYDVVTGPNG